ncbi:DUF418 domain-containing protein [Dyadobacter arcticus]|uniref:Membrane protein YeiB n=1 Tax=Dyadobacter arcticus TaxID=1078754 RepID=A0ABX0UP40_9BACT|nr:DUF418 domain-containing protein [Dyadobacter arcticus]NIJ54208.1 putative membrane protein YeiB [Dyadobacter arcticus]
MQKTLSPTTVTERQSLLDVLRGFALLGVLLANMVSHSGYFFLSKAGREALGTTEIDHYALSMFLVGFYISKNMIYGNVQAFRPLIKKVMIWGAVIGIPCNIVLAVMMTTEAYYELEPIGIIQPIVYALGVPALCLFYAAVFALLFENPTWKQRLMIFAPVGQMALTNYLMQSVICAFIFMSYGSALEAQLGPAKLALIAFTIYIAQLIYSSIWLHYFRYGPAEWLWRSLTYRKWQPFRKELF